MHIFSRDPEVVAIGAAYLVRVAPLYAFTGLGMALYFASQGAGRMLWPFTAGATRLGMVFLAGSYWIHVAHGPITGLFWIVATSQVVFGGINAIAMASGRSWKPLPALHAVGG
jgi:Na+-driven multidrug efflux pump